MTVPQALKAVLTPAYPGQLPHGWRIKRDEIKLVRDEKEILLGMTLNKGQEVVINTYVPGHKMPFPVTYVISELIPPYSSISPKTTVVVEGEIDVSSKTQLTGKRSVEDIEQFLTERARRTISRLEEDIQLCIETGLSYRKLEDEIGYLRKTYGI